MPAIMEPDSVADTVEKYAEIQDKIIMSLEEAVDLSRGLARVVECSGFAPQHIVGIANGALLPTRVVSDELGVACEFIRMRRQGSRWKRRLARIPGLRAGFSALFSIDLFARAVRPIIDRFNRLENAEQAAERHEPGAGQRILLVDDAIESGQSIAAAQALLEARGAAEVRIAVISWSSRVDSSQLHGVVPHFFLNRRLQHFPWSENNPGVHDYRAWLAERDLKEWD